MRKHLFWKAPLALMAVLAGAGVTAASAADVDLIGHWAFDDGAGIAAVDSAGTNNGVLIGGPTWRTVGRIGGALAFDGIDDLVDLGVPDYTVPPFDLTNQLTIAIWMRADDFGASDARLISRAIGTAEQDHVWMVSTVGETGLRFRLKTSGVTSTLVSGTDLLQTARWHHVAAVYDGAEMRLYLDGEEVAAVAKTGPVDAGLTAEVALGNQPPGAGSRPFDGQLDELRLYRRALASAEILDLAFPAANQPPWAEFTANPAMGRPPLQVSFDALSSVDADGSIVSYAWDFGDGTTGSGLQIDHTFGDLGDFTVVLTVTDNDGITATSSLVIVVTENPDIPFTHDVIDDNPPALTHSKAAGDVDGDGLQDVLVAGGGSGEGLFWYRNPTWERSTIVPPGVSGFTTDMIMGDADGDGDLDAVIPKGFDIGIETFWYENPRPAGDPAAGPWTEHTIGVAGAHDVEAGDFDGDGRLDVVVRWGATTLFLQVADDVWTSVVLNTRSSEGLEVFDLDADGDQDVVINGRWLENPLPGGDPGQGPWIEHDIDTNWPGAVRVHATDLDANGHADVIFAASESAGERLSWYSTLDPVNGPWTEHIIANQADYVHSLEAADMDLDGDLDVVTAEMHQSTDPDEVIVHLNEGGGLGWRPQVVALTGSHNLIATDMDADGDVDLVGANHALPPLEMWRNELNPGARLSLEQWQRVVVTANMPWQAIFIEPVLIDDDDLPDIVTGGWWFRNPGSATAVWERFDLGLPLRNMAAVHDFDGDGDQDVIGTEGVGFASNSDFVWAQNDGLGGFTVIENIPSASGSFLQGTTVARLQAGGPQEVVLSWQNGFDTQMLTVPESPATEPWSWRVAANASLGEGLDYGDIDRDGDLDILQGTQWLRNEGGDVWTAIELFPPTPPGEPDRVYLVDLNRDGRLDALVGYGHDRPYGSVAWFEQPPVASDQWLEHVVDHPFNPGSLDIADLDLDGDVDIVMGEHNLHNPTASELQIYENLDGFGISWRPHLVYLGDEHHDAARLFDVEGDGDLDIVSIGYTHERMMIYENLSSHIQAAAAPDEGGTAVPSRLTISPAYPNPFNPATHLRYDLPTAARVNLAVYDIRGRLVAQLVDRQQGAGRHEVLFAPRGLASGVYLAHLKAGGQVRTMRMTLVK